MPIGQILIIVAVAVIFLGWGHRVLDRMRLNDTAALILLGLMFLAPFLPDLRVGGGLRVDLFGFLVPVGVAAYLMLTADHAYEKRRALVAAVVVGATVFALDALLPPEPGMLGRLDVDPIYLNGLLAGVVGYLAGRSRRAAFIAGVLGLALADIGSGFLNLARGVTGPFATLGGAGAFDAMVVAGFLGVLLAEVVGESREYLTRTAAGQRAGEGDEGDQGEAQPGRGQRAGPGADQVAGAAVGTPLAVALAVSLALAGTAATVGHRAWPWADELTEAEIQRGLFYRLVDERGEELTRLNRRVWPGDQYIDTHNRLWEVVRVEGRRGVTRLRGTVDLLAPDPEADRAAAEAERRWQRAGLLNQLFDAPREGGGDQIVVYHTHNDESYIRGDGEPITNGRGGIHQVGEELTRALREKGYEVLHDETLHLPHDRSAYRRSRRTVMEYLDNRPLMLVDVHRDAVPPSVYADEWRGEGITRVRIVIGRQNPTRAANLREAKRIKAVADSVKQGYVRYIFIGRGNYNQDFGPRALLFEFGAHTNARASAERSAPLLAEALDRYLDQYRGR